MRTGLADLMRHGKRITVFSIALLFATSPLVAQVVWQPNKAPNPLRPGHSLALPHFRDCPNCPEMVVVPAGSFMAGPRSSERDPKIAYTLESQKRITFAKPFAIGRYEVTWGEYEPCVKAGVCRGFFSDEIRTPTPGWPGEAETYPRSHPIEDIRREDMERYAAWLSQKTGRRYRLPSSMEWEYAARAGTDSVYWWGNEPAIGWEFIHGMWTPPTGRHLPDMTYPVGRLPPNQWGLHDMLGNVREVVSDCLVAPRPQLANTPTDGRPLLVPGCDAAVVRGGQADKGGRGQGRNSASAISGLPLTGVGHGFRLAADVSREER